MDKTIYIIGYGVFGLSAALHLSKVISETSAKLVILSHPSPQSPSNDISKIVRIDYANVDRMKEALHAQGFWKNDVLFSRFYQSVGRVIVYDRSNLSTLNSIDESRRSIGKSARLRFDKSI
ncbi:hypothetical protein M501DRAFT_1004180 [Patellaria atrata CBS 101060]|uniref:FAD/NAD(P)-binding domain-containing protein n=1 Tax=Patellaria atrata CBS 101060 TaxID=1346257 RepID=A0A9P4S9Q9_9PEZI|nr:hypothetical protein M501DRAFT_1004180 [Patellaria atrata CBS 101060]